MMWEARYVGQWWEVLSVLSEPPHLVCSDIESEALAALGQGKHDRALTILMKGYGEAIYRYCRRMLGGCLAEDAHQMTFVHAYENLESFCGDSSLRVWLYGIARHRCLDALRKKRYQMLATDQQPEAVAAEPAVDQVLAVRQVLIRCLQKLKTEVREIVILRYLEELSFLEIAAICKKDPATLQMRMARALPLLRKCVEANSR